MKRILASDIDGTLLINGEIATTTLEAIKCLKEAGHSFILCTGRDFANTKQVFEQYALEIDGLVLCNGALILDTHLQPYYEKNIKQDIVNEIYNTYNNREGFYMAYIDGYKTYMDHYPDFVDQMALKVEKVTKKQMDERSGHIKLISLIALGATVEEVEQIKNQLNDKYQDHIIAYRNQTFIDIVPKGCSKAAGIARLMDELEGSEDHIYVIGDSWNDLSMFESYPLSFTFNHVEENLKSYVKYTVDSVEDCIRHLLEKK